MYRASCSGLSNTSSTRILVNQSIVRYLRGYEEALMDVHTWGQTRLLPSLRRYTSAASAVGRAFVSPLYRLLAGVQQRDDEIEEFLVRFQNSNQLFG